MTIENLIKAVPPPVAPFEAFKGPWEVIEADLGISLPQDYKDLARLYGNGWFMDYVGIDIPNTQDPNTRLEWRAEIMRDFYLAMLEDFRSFPIWPDPDGLLPLGGTSGGNALFWLTHGPPADWHIVVWDRGLGRFETFDFDLTDFLSGLATGEILPKDFPDELLSRERLFQPNSAPGPATATPPSGVKLSWRMTPPHWDFSSATQQGDGGAFNDVVIAGRIAPGAPPK